MSQFDGFVVGVDTCPLGWFATAIDTDGVETGTYEELEEVTEAYSRADRILVDIPIGFPTNERRRYDERARNLLGSRGNSVFYPPCRRAAEASDYQEASDKHRDAIGYGLYQEAYHISPKILEVAEVVGTNTTGRSERAIRNSASRH